MHVHMDRELRIAAHAGGIKLLAQLLGIAKGGQHSLRLECRIRALPT